MVPTTIGLCGCKWGWAASGWERRKGEFREHVEPAAGQCPFPPLLSSLLVYDVFSKERTLRPVSLQEAGEETVTPGSFLAEALSLNPYLLPAQLHPCAGPKSSSLDASPRLPCVFRPGCDSGPVFICTYEPGDGSWR